LEELNKASKENDDDLFNDDEFEHGEENKIESQKDRKNSVNETSQKDRKYSVNETSPIDDKDK